MAHLESAVPGYLVPGRGVPANPGDPFSSDAATGSDSAVIITASLATGDTASGAESAFVNAGGVTSAARAFAANIGDGTSAGYTVTHNLHTRDVVVRIYDLVTFEEVSARVVAASADTVTATFAEAPATNAYRVVVFG